MDEFSLRLDIKEMKAFAQETGAFLRAFANEDRILLLAQMTYGEKSVSELKLLLDIRQPTLSQQLGVLRKDGLVATRRAGKKIYYTLADPRVPLLLSKLCALYKST